jgi:DNA-binding NarL/FixJ family response regulator
MVGIVIFSADPVLRRSLEELLGGIPNITIVGVTDNPSAVPRLIDQIHVDAVLADAPPHEQLADWQNRHDETAFVVLVDGADEEDSREALYAGARAICLARPSAMKSSSRSRQSQTALPSCRGNSFQRCSTDPQSVMVYLTATAQAAHR